MSKGLFITFEGIEGCGKTTQARLLYEALLEKGLKTVLTEEPGGTSLGQKLRKLLLEEDHSIHPLTELLLYNASRAQHVMEKIRPLLKEGAIVICDRFMDSTFAYQGYGRGIEGKIIRSLDEISRQGLLPDITFLIDIDPEMGLKRHYSTKVLDRLERESLDFHRLVREGYLELARLEPERFRIINGAESIEHIHHIIVNTVLDQLVRG